MGLKNELLDMAKMAQAAGRRSFSMSSETKDKVLKSMAASLFSSRAKIILANKKDIAVGKKEKLSAALIDRLTLDDKRIRQMSDSLVEIAALTDPVGEVIKAWRRPNGLWIHKVRAPIGVIAIIYESRPNVTSDCVGLCFKSGNSVILRGGSESLNSNLAIYKIIREIFKKFKIDEAMVNMVQTTDRRAIDELLKLSDYIDLVMPRGGEGLIRKVASVSRIPVFSASW